MLTGGVSGARFRGGRGLMMAGEEGALRQQRVRDLGQPLQGRGPYRAVGLGPWALGGVALATPF